MSDGRSWRARLRAEIAHELGHAVTLEPGGESSEGAPALRHRLELPGARLKLAVTADELAALLAEARVVNLAQTDELTLRELWTGMLNSIAAGLGGKLGAAEFEPEPQDQVWVLRLGSASMRIAVGIEESASRNGDALAESNPAAAGNYDLLLDVELDASVRFGSREMELGAILELGPGDVVELDRQVSDPVDLIVGDKIVARGEVVLVNGNFGLRVTEVAEPAWRLESIRWLW